VGDPLADAFLGGLIFGARGQAELRQKRLVGEAVKGDAEGCAAPGSEGGLDFDKRAVDGSGEGSEDEVDALEGELAFAVGETAVGNVFGEDDGRWGLALGARWEDFFGDDLCAGSGEASDEAGEGAFGDAARSFSRAHRLLRCDAEKDSPGTREKRVRASEKRGNGE